MLNATKAARLAERASRLRADGSRGARARLAWRRLARAGDCGNLAAATATWRAWVSAPGGAAGEELWQALARWRDPQKLAEEVFEAATDPDSLPAIRTALGEFCARHSLVPEDLVRRAMFYVLTGQVAQHRAADPDGRLLAAGYGLSAEPVRAALRGTLASAGDLDIVRVVSGGERSRARQLTAKERDYLNRHLAGRRDWAGLWDLARDLPLADAVAATRLFGDGWRPRGDREGALFGRLARAEPAAIAASAGALASPVVIDIQTDAVVTRGSFSPDGRQLLVAVSGDRTGYSGVRVYDLPSGSLRERHDYPGKLAPPAIVHLGSAFLVVGQRRDPVWELVRYAEDQPHVFHWSKYQVTVSAHPAGFVVLEKLGPERRWRLALYDAGGAIRSDSQADFGDNRRYPGQLYRVAADPVSGRIVVCGDGLWVLSADGSAVIAEAEQHSEFSAACFTGPDSLAAVNRSAAELRRYLIAGNRLELEASVPLQLAGPPTSPAVIRRRGEVAVCTRTLGRVRYLDAQTLAETSHPDELGGLGGTELWGSVDGRSQALGLQDRAGRGFARVIWGEYVAARELAGRPMGGMAPADLQAVAAARSGPVPDTAAWPFLELLQDCLELRFEADVGLAGARPLAGDDDIGLSVAGEWSG